MADENAREEEHEGQPEPVAPDDPKPDDEVAAAIVFLLRGLWR